MLRPLLSRRLTSSVAKLRLFQPSAAMSSASYYDNVQANDKHTKAKPFDKILIANRGEIACRVIRTCKRMGIKTVAVYSEPDARALHVQQADEAYCIGPAQSLQSYLAYEKIIDVIKQSGAQAVHPGYGFLSERGYFSKAVEEAGAVFMGPTEYSLGQMGDKITSKKIAKKAGVRTVPGYEGVVKDAEEAVKISNQIGYPVMVKASAGGGGKGMRVAYNDQEVRDGYRLSKAEAASSFKDDRIFVEKFIENPHHIEIQLLADNFGNVAAFPERECSIQRRNQKVLEESPSCLPTPETRLALQNQAAALAKAVQYRGAGTVEFLMDEKQNFYFLEMNTRLQVEHPITEYVSGEDLVEHMLWIGAGEPLPERLTKTPVAFKGHALEARVYAEDPLRGFLPSTGPLHTYKEPSTSEVEDGKYTCRIDTGIFEGFEISMFYDPMISKLITYGKTRKDSIARMHKALDNYVVTGVNHNICYLKELCRNPRFNEAKTTTNFIPQEYPKGFHGVELKPEEKDHAIASAVLMHLMKEDTAYSVDGQLSSTNPGVMRNFHVTIGKGKNPEAFGVEMDPSSNEDSALINVTDASGNKRSVKISAIDWNLGSPLFKAEINGQPRVVQSLGGSVAGNRLFYEGAYMDVKVFTGPESKFLKHMLPEETIDQSKFLLCPMPGALISLAVKEGDEVEVGQELAVVEAMKMQNILRAPRHTKIKKVRVQAGQNLKVDQIIVDFE